MKRKRHLNGQLFDLPDLWRSQIYSIFLQILLYLCDYGFWRKKYTLHVCRLDIYGINMRLVVGNKTACLIWSPMDDFGCCQRNKYVFLLAESFFKVWVIFSDLFVFNPMYLYSIWLYLVYTYSIWLYLVYLYSIWLYLVYLYVFNMTLSDVSVFNATWSGVYVFNMTLSGAYVFKVGHQHRKCNWFKPLHAAAAHTDGKEDGILGGEKKNVSSRNF